MADVDERIRTVLDLGDSSGVVKALDQELEKLLADFKKQTELFEKGQVSSKAYTDSLNKMKSEVGAVSSAIKDLGGGGGGGGAVDLEGVNRKLFALERGMTSLTSGTGLGRAAGALESGLGLFGGPAGLGVLLALFANTIDNIMPKLNEFWAHLWRKQTWDEMHAKVKELAEEGKKAKESMDALFMRPAPGPGAQQAEQVRENALQEIFNRQIQRGAGLQKGIEDIIRRGGIKGHWQESSEISGLREQQEDIRGLRTPRALAAIVSYAPQGLFGKAAQDQAIFELETQIKKIVNDNVIRRANQLMVNATLPGEAGIASRKQLIEMITANLDLFEGRGPLIIAKLREADREPYRPPTPEAISQDEQARVEWAMRRMERVGSYRARQNLQFIIESGGKEFVGPPPPSFAESRRKLLDIERQKRIGRRRAGVKRFRVGPSGESLGPPSALRGVGAAGRRPDQTGPARRRDQLLHHITIPRPKPVVEISPQMEEINRQAEETRIYQNALAIVERFGRHSDKQEAIRAKQILEKLNMAAVEDPQYQKIAAVEEQIHELRTRQVRALQLEEQGLRTHAKTQQVVQGLDYQIGRLLSINNMLERNADNLLRKQQRSQQNVTGRP